MSTKTIPLFPLHTVLFPGGTLPLRIFEPRYTDMISGCMKSGSGFGVCLIREGSEVGQAAETYDIGTLSEVAYFDRQADGLLGITALGRQRFQIVGREVRQDQLVMAEVELIENEPVIPLPREFDAARDTLRSLLEQLGHPFITMDKRYEEAGWVGSRLAELLPIRLEQKQYFLQLDDPVQRLERISALLEDLELR